MLKKYIYKGKEWQYEEGEQPKGAVELRPKQKAAEPPKNKAVKPTNKSRAVRKK
jgi:hypothetical protein